MPKDSVYPKETESLPGFGLRMVGGVAYLTLPSLIPGIGRDTGRKAVWIGASGDQLYVKVDEALINPRTMHNASIIANKDVIGKILPPRALQITDANFWFCLVVR
jgi:hypothetical protein